MRKLFFVLCVIFCVACSEKENVACSKALPPWSNENVQPERDKWLGKWRYEFSPDSFKSYQFKTITIKATPNPSILQVEGLFFCEIEDTATLYCRLQGDSIVGIDSTGCMSWFKVLKWKKSAFRIQQRRLPFWLCYHARNGVKL